MFITTVKYKDFKGNERTTELCFNLTKSELRKIETESEVPMSNALSKVYNNKDDKAALVKTISDFVHMSYGELTNDGIGFIKKKSDGTLLVDEFMQTAAYDAFMNKLYDEDHMIIDFCMGIMPSDIQEQIKKEALKSDPELEKILNRSVTSENAAPISLMSAT